MTSGITRVAVPLNQWSKYVWREIFPAGTNGIVLKVHLEASERSCSATAIIGRGSVNGRGHANKARISIDSSFMYRDIESLFYRRGGPAEQLQGHREGTVSHRIRGDPRNAGVSVVL